MADKLRENKTETQSSPSLYPKGYERPSLYPKGYEENYPLLCPKGCEKEVFLSPSSRSGVTIRNLLMFSPFTEEEMEKIPSMSPEEREVLSNSKKDSKSAKRWIEIYLFMREHFNVDEYKDGSAKGFGKGKKT